MNLIEILPLVFLLAAIVALLVLIGVFRNHRVALAITWVGLLAAFGGLSASLRSGATSGMLLSLDPFAVFYIGLSLLAALFVSALSYEYLKASPKPEEYYLLLLTGTLGAAVLAASTHFASFFLGLEILSVSLYTLIAYPHFGSRGIEGALKYLVLAGTSSAILLFGMALVYDATGTMRIGELASSLMFRPGEPLAGVGWVLILVGIGFKLGLVPFHMWAPDVYEGSPAPVTAFVATVSKGAIFSLFLRYASVLSIQESVPLWVILSFLSGASMTVGNLLALRQKNLKRLLAYSSTAHLGYLLLAILARNHLGANAAGFYLASYFATTLAAFGVMSLLSKPGRDAERIDDYRGLFWSRPALAGVFSLAVLSLAGIPLTAGFTGKFYLASAGIGSGLWFLTILLMLNSAIGLYYYLRVIVAMAAAPEAAPAHDGPARPVAQFALAALALTVLWLGIFPSSMVGAIQAAMRDLR